MSQTLENKFKPGEEHKFLLTIIRDGYKDACHCISQGNSYQEELQYGLARDMYTRGLDKMASALSVRCDRPYCRGPEWAEAILMVQEMNETSRMVRTNLHAIESALVASSNADCDNVFKQMGGNAPDSDESEGEADQQTNDRAQKNEANKSEARPIGGGGDHAHPDLPANHQVQSGEDPDQAQPDPRQPSCPALFDERSDHKTLGSTEVVELFSLEDGVAMFFVARDGRVSSASSQSSLHVYQFVDSDAGRGVRPPAWLQVQGWTYPLVPGQSPVLKSGYGAFLFPHIGSGEGSAVSIILPASVDAPKREKFMNILKSFAAFKEENDQSEDHSTASSISEAFSDVLSRGIVSGAEYLSAGIVRKADVGSEIIHRGAERAIESISPNDEAVHVGSHVRDGLEMAETASGIALLATGYLVQKLGDLTVSLGQQVAPYIKEQSDNLSSVFSTDENEPKNKFDSVFTVAGGGIQGISSIYMGLAHAAKTLAYSLSAETVNIVGHKYGNEVGEVVDHALFSIGNLAQTTLNMQSFGVKAIAKGTAKDTGKAVLRDYNRVEE